MSEGLAVGERRPPWQQSLRHRQRESRCPAIDSPTLAEHESDSNDLASIPSLSVCKRKRTRLFVQLPIKIRSPHRLASSFSVSLLRRDSIQAVEHRYFLVDRLLFSRTMNSPGSPCTAKVGFQKTSLFYNNQGSIEIQHHRSSVSSYLIQTRRVSVDDDDFRFSRKNFTVAKAKVAHRSCNDPRVQLSIERRRWRDAHRAAAQHPLLSTLLFDNAETGWHDFCRANLAPSRRENTEYPSTRTSPVPHSACLQPTDLPPELRLHHASTSAVEYFDFPVDIRDFEQRQSDS